MQNFPTGEYFEFRAPVTVVFLLYIKKRINKNNVYIEAKLQVSLQVGRPVTVNKVVW